METPGDCSRRQEQFCKYRVLQTPDWRATEDGYSDTARPGVGGGAPAMRGGALPAGLQGAKREATL